MERPSQRTATDAGLVPRLTSRPGLTLSAKKSDPRGRAVWPGLQRGPPRRSRRGRRDRALAQTDGPSSESR